MHETPQQSEASEALEYVQGFIWQAPEYFHREKTADWFWGLGIVTVTLIIVSIIYDNIIFALFLGLAAFTLALFAHRPPRTVTIQIGPRGILLEHTLYHYSDIESFWLREEDLHPKILLKSKKTFMPYIVIPLGNPREIDPEDLRQYLLGFMREAIHEEPIMQRLMEYLGF